MSVVLLLACPDQPGIVAATAGFIAGLNGNIIHAEQHVDKSSDSGNTDAAFFQRIEFDLSPSGPSLEEFAQQFEVVARRFDMHVDIYATDLPSATAILASRQPHCLYDLLSRWKSGELPMDLRVVISNHDDHRAFCEHLGVSFVHLPTSTIPPTDQSRSEHDARLVAMLEANGVELVVLARYMQILGPDMIAAYPSQIINIHHSFLPAFVGANPYGQAYERGVKLIGATAHYATSELDEGPIIEQDTVHVTHRDDVRRLTAKGRDLETIVLARALRAHLEHRVLVYGRKTVVFS